MADSENPTHPDKATSPSTDKKGSKDPRSPPSQPPEGVTGSGRWRWEPDPPGNGQGVSAQRPAASGGGGLLGFISLGGGGNEAVTVHDPLIMQGAQRQAAAGADRASAREDVQSPERLSTHLSGLQGRDLHKRLAMPCITLVCPPFCEKNLLSRADHV